MAERTLTAANSIFTLSVAGLFTTPQQLVGYSADAAFEVDAPDQGEFIMGVDGRMSGGFIPAMQTQVITLQADSPSIDLFDKWRQTQQQRREILWASATVILPALGKQYAHTKGGLKISPTMPGVKKTLGPQAFTIVWQSITGAPR